MGSTCHGAPKTARGWLAPLLALVVAGCGPPKVVYEGGARFRAGGDQFQIDTGDGTGWRPFFAKGVNLAIATPGTFPGDLAATPWDYYRWLDRLAELNCNVVRAYTLHFPFFYDTLGKWNRDHPATPIYLVQGIWLDELEQGDYITDGSQQLAEEIRYVVDAVHGEADIDERRGKAYGTYRSDISSYLMAWLPGHEMDGQMVALSNKRWASYTRYDGRYLSSPEGLPIESWVGRNLDQVVSHELEKYGAQHPVAWSNWPALDPIHHPTETTRYGQDVVDVDFGRFKSSEPFTAGLFVSYHVYPFNPEFIIYDPKYAATIDASGKPNSYLGYLLDLKAHHPGVPLFITEYGVPSSMGVAHITETAYNHGGYSEQQQADAVVDLYRAIRQAGAAGAVVFELIDEWFKRNWMTNATTIPMDRARLWLDMMNPEESFGLISYYPLAESITVDGRTEDWAGVPELVSQPAQPVAPAGDGRDDARTLAALRLTADPAFLFLRLDTAGTGPPDLENTIWMIGLSTVDGPSGDRRFPDLGVRVAPEQGLEAVVVLDGKNGVYELRTDAAYDPAPRLSGTSKTGGQPLPNDAGTFALSTLLVNGDSAYLAEGKAFVPQPKHYQPGLLRRGDSSKDTLSHFELGNGVLELRIPWHALWVTDPSSRQVLDDDPSTPDFDASATSGIQIMVLTAVRGTSGARVVDALPRSAFAGGEFTAAVPRYSWPTWESVSTQERLKPVFHSLKQAYGASP
jgi:hypothetical protein